MQKWWIPIKEIALLTALVVAISSGSRCPPIFGAFECPLHYQCINSSCLSDDTKELAPDNCSLVTCSPKTRCYKGRCYETTGLMCDRNVIVSKLSAKSISSDCGQNGKCLNGRCVEDRCLGVTCAETQLCRDGKCTEMSDKFCFADFDCGPYLDCVNNKCVFFRKGVQCNCDPEEICQDGQCFPDPKCGHITCPDGQTCSDGVCVSAIGRDCSLQVCPTGMVCVQGKCALDECNNRCPVEHACRRGQCRHLQGLLCDSECPTPYECVDGLCTKNNCAQKICQMGESCENGFCFRVEGRFCLLAIRDCGAGFECVSNQCKDTVNP